MAHPSDPKLQPDRAHPLYAVLAQYWRWLALLLVGKQPLSDYIITGFSARIDTGKVLVVVRALRIEDMTLVVCFGSGERLYEALRNVNTTIVANGWKVDKYKKFV